MHKGAGMSKTDFTSGLGPGQGGIGFCTGWRHRKEKVRGGNESAGPWHKEETPSPSTAARRGADMAHGSSTMPMWSRYSTTVK